VSVGHQSPSILALLSCFNAVTSRSNRSTRSKSPSKGVRSIASAVRAAAFQARRSHVPNCLLLSS
jgi:hypothetical protein